MSPTYQTSTVQVSTKRLIHHRDHVCQYVSPHTGKKCESKWQLQVDHIQPRWAGGSHDLQNLKLLCAQHNRLKYRLESGRMSGWGEISQDLSRGSVQK